MAPLLAAQPPPSPPPPPTPGPGVPPIELNPGHVPPVPPAGPAPPTPPGREDSAWYDIAGQVGKAITDWVNSLVHDGLSAMLDLLARTALITPDVTADPRVVQIWGVTQGIANSAYVLLVVAGGVLVMSHETLQTRHAFKQIAPRVVVGFVALNTSLSVIGEVIRLANAAAAALLGADATPDAVGERLKTQVLDTLDQQAGIFLLLVALVVLVLSVVLLIVFVMRVALTVLLVSVAPLALACRALPGTEGAERLWWRSLGGVVTIQLAQALTLIVALRVFFTPTGIGGFGGGGALMDLVVTLVMVWVLVRIPAWVGRYLFGSRPSTLSTLVKYAVLSRALSHVGLGRGGGRAIAGRAVTGQSAGARPRPTRGGGAASPMPPEYPATAGNPHARAGSWWATPTLREPGTRPPVGPPRFQPPRPTASHPTPPRPTPPRAATTRWTARAVSATPTFSNAPASTSARTPTAARTGRAWARPTFSDAAPPPTPAARGGSPVATFRAPPRAGSKTATPASRRRGSGRTSIPPADQRRPDPTRQESR